MMKSINIAELKNRLSAYLSEVRAGEELLVRDRNVPIARIVPLRADDYDAELLKLASQGRVRLGSGAPLDKSFWDSPAPRISMETVKRLIDEERSEDQAEG
jgi:prevent-host-death family protein